MIEARQHDALLARRAEPLVEAVLRAAMHDPVRAGNQQLRRHGDRRRVRDDPLRGVVQVEQHVDRDRPRDQRIGHVARDALGVVREEFRLHVAVHVEQPAQLVHQPQAGPRERHVELDVERRRRDRQAADRRRVIVRPGRREHRADALADDGDILDRDAMCVADMLDEGLQVAHRRGRARAVAARAGRAAVAARVPGEERELGQVELVDEVRDARRMLVAAMQQHDRAAAAGARRGPVTVEQRFAVVRGEFRLAGNACAHAISLVSLFEATRRRPPASPTQPPASAMPARTRRTTVTADSTISSRHSHAARPPAGRPTPIHSANAPSANARSLLPNGPS